MFSLPVPKRLNPWLAYPLVAASVALSVAVRYPMYPLLHNSAPYSTFYLAVFLTAWAGGFWPGLACTLLSGVAAEYFLIEPLYDLRFSTREDWIGTLMFVGTGIVTSLLCESLRLATDNSLLSAVRAKASAQAAQTARDRERSLLESIADGFVAFDRQWRIAFANEPAAKMLGRRREELVGKHMVSLYPNVVLSESYAKLRKAVEEQSAVHFEVYDAANDRWYGNSGYPSATGVSLFARDITESRKLADAVRESEERFRIMADSAPLLIWTSTRTGQRDYVNRLFPQFSGRTYGEELGRGWMDRVHPDDRGRVRRTYEEATESQSGFVIEYRMLREDGEYRWMLDSGAPRFSPRGEYMGSVGSCLDISDRRRAEEAQRESEAQLRLSMSVSQTGTWRHDLIANRIVWSPEIEKIFGLAPNSYPHTVEFMYSLVHPDDRERLRKVQEPVYAQGGECEVEFRFFRQDGETRWLFVRGQGMLDATGRCVAITGLGIDITERKVLDERVRHAQKLESLGVLAGGIAHDFNNLLTGILGSANMVIEELEPHSLAWNLQRNAIDASQRAAQLTNQMLAYSGKGHFVVERINVTQFVRDSISLVHAAISNKKVDLKLSLGEDCIVEADPAQLQQVVMNLVINGAEAIPEDQAGTVRIATSLVTLDDDAADLKGGDYAVLQVEDTGIGMDAETLSRIFDPFFTTKFMGRGLGLAAVQGIVRGHQGTLRVTSTPGIGTIFQVLLPRAEGGVERRPKEAMHDWRGSETILIVDDEEMVRLTAQASLEYFGYRVVAVGDGLSAVELLRQSPDMFDAVLLDMTMPVMSGQEALPALRGIRADIKVIVCSGYSEAEAVERFGAGGLDAFLQKPFTGPQLAEKVRAVIGGDSPKDERGERRGAAASRL